MQADADRGQSIQVGAVLLFGVLILLLATWQAVVVPQENESIEFNHNRQIQGQVQELRNAIISLGDGGTTAGVRVTLGTTYPTRVLFVNPEPPSGSIRTAGTTSDLVNVSVQHASAAGDAGDFWDGTDHNYTTGGLAYEPNYNLYDNAPRTTYGNSVLYNDFGAQNLTLAGQTLVDGNRITLVTLNGSLARTQTEATTVDVRPVTASTHRLGVVNATAGQRLTITIPTQLSAQNWTRLLDEQLVANGGHVTGVTQGPAIAGTDHHLVSIHLERGVRYRLSLARVGVGTDVDTTIPARYLTKTAGNGSVVPENTTKTLEVAVWDRFNNPVTGVSVNASTRRTGSAVTVAGVSDGDGRIELRYEAPSDIDGGAKTDEVNVSMTMQPSAAGAGFDPETPTNVSFDLTVDNADRSGTGGGGGGTAAYDLAWNYTLIESKSGIRGCFTANETCVYDLSQDPDGQVNLTAGTDPTTVDAFVDFTSNNTLVTLVPSENRTASTGLTVTTVSPSGPGVVNLSALSTESDDVVTFEVVPGGGGSGPTINNPSITDVTDGNGIVADGDTIRVSAAVTDPDGISSVTTDASVFGGPSTLTLTDGNNDDVYDATFTVDEATAGPDGSHSLVITATDSTGDSSSDTTNALILDTTPPAIQVTSPADGASVSNTQVEITASLSDATTSVDASTISVTVQDSDGSDGPEFSSAGTGTTGVSYDAGTGTLTINASDAGVSYANGQVSVSITADDLAGNTGSESSTFTVASTIDNFEDGNINEYTGAVNQFQTVTSPVSDGTYALQATPTGNAIKRITSTSGLPLYPHQGDKFRYAIRKPPHSKSPYVGQVRFGTTSAGNHYTVEVVQQGNSNNYRLRLSNGASTQESATFTFSNDEWHEVTVDWGSSNIVATIKDSTDTQLGSVTVTSAGDSGDYLSFASQRGTTYWDHVRLVP